MRATRASDADMAGSASHPPFPSGWRRAAIWASRGPVRGGGHEALRGADDRGGLARGPGQFGCPAGVEHLPGGDGPGVRVEQGLRDHGGGLPDRLDLFGGQDGHPLGVRPELADLGVPVTIALEDGRQVRPALDQGRIEEVG